ncbi:Crp/Fnr family transcriptional regulator [Planctomicrobium piriforme]|uniref:Cyclic nucleotide-binding domain-containing protein n=1 Tax=Planctomicrobium piriforme TaxID=1576369 RepID=A0A1I3QAX3_9PLAN|nr:cyclic nucleotide-binding domain-containing protein [Planctomicrobium piriforme]SFJ30860.1 Cyclic nucleotide-binding domain-containing protein [Planctomicrobium piriforme]
MNAMTQRDPIETIGKFNDVFERCTLLSGLTSEEMLAFLRRVQFEGFTSGDEILTEGNQYHGVWILLRGTCEVIKHGPKRDSRLATLEPGNVFGEMSFFHPVGHSATVRAVDHVETMRLMLDGYEQLRQDCPTAAHKIALNIIRILSDRLRRMDEWTCELVERNSDGHGYKEWQEFRSKLYTNLFE